MTERINRFLGYIHDDPKRFWTWALNRISPIFNDTEYIKLMYLIRFEKKPNLDNPKTFNEKLQWLKLRYHNPIFTDMADKYAVKQIVREKIGDEYVVPNYGVWDKFESIDFTKLPDQFVLKCTHDSGGAFVCHDKSNFDFKSVRKNISKNLKRNFYYAGREWPYKNIPHRIIADKYLDDHTGAQLRDYKFWCFNGMPKYMYCTIKGANTYENFYDMDFNVSLINHGYPRYSPEFVKPDKFDEMKYLAEILSKGIPFVRVDFFLVDGHIYFGEYTFFDWGGMRPFATEEIDLELGNLIELPRIKD